jgi:hypothetical protein
VLAVYEDGDCGVYRHNISTWDGSSLWKKGSWVGETWLWDEFLEHGSFTGKVENTIATGTRILFGASWNDDLSSWMQMADLSLSPVIALNSRTGGIFDIKNIPALAPYGPTTGKLLNGKYATAESAGNFLAGYNAASHGWAAETIMRTAGGLHVGENLHFGTGPGDALLGFLGVEFGPPPYYGETFFAGFYIQMGINYGWR